MDSLHDSLKSKVTDKTNWKTYPILLRWYESRRMQNTIAILEKKVEYLLDHGAISKINEWISNDKALTQITAERYILDYLRIKNANFTEMFTGGGVDGFLINSDSCVGIEVTTVNQSIPEWILQERLLLYLAKNNYNGENGIEVIYDLSKLEAIKYDNLEIIEKIGVEIIRNNYHPINGVSVRKISKRGSYISWNNTETDDNFFVNIQRSLIQIITQKSKQLSKNKQNILFIGVNQLPNSIFNPGIFKEMSGHIYHQDWVDELEKIVKDSLPECVLGVCFFVYTLESEEMMYPLHIIWSDSKKKIPINL